MGKKKFILIMGLPGSGKSTLAKKLAKILKAKWLNADKVRSKYKDWDFSKKGILRQSKRMSSLSKKLKSKYVVADFICPYSRGRKIFKPNYIVWMDTIKKGRFKKNSIDDQFEKPRNYDFRIKKKNAKVWSKKISTEILNSS